VRAVLDTVIFVRALINPRGPSGALLGSLQSKYTIVLSPDIIREIMDVTRRSNLEERLGVAGDAPPVERVLDLIQNADVINPGIKLHVCRDPKDNKFFECAVAASADYIVSEDEDILDVAVFEGVRTVNAADFAKILRETRA